jgi:HAD superfamily hydrolase (TIGR01509 family)
MCTTPRDITAVLFDLDGVVIDSYHAWFHQFQQTLLHFGYKPVSESEFRKHWGQSTEDDVRMFMPDLAVQEVKEYFCEHYDEYLQHLSMEPGADHVLKLVQELRLRSGCVTNSHHHIVTNTLRHFGIGDYFETVVTADDVEIPKPGPEMILKACVNLNTSPQNTVFIGDTGTDALAADGAGCLFIAYRTAGKIRMGSMNELAAWLERAVTEGRVQ